MKKVLITAISLLLFTSIVAQKIVKEYYSNGQLKSIGKQYSVEEILSKNEDLSYKKWSKRFNYFLNYVDTICASDLFILGGGISNKYHKFKDSLDIKTPLLMAQAQNNAGIVGAAVARRR